ncbi:MAG: hypothetical protein RLZZ490_1102 [Cyanobacteriota bacterium]
MLVPLLSFAIGVCLLFASFLIFRGLPLINRLPILPNLKNNLLFVWGNGLIALAAMLGVAGYYNIFRGDDLRLGRLVLFLLGIVASGLGIIETLDDRNPLKKLDIRDNLKGQGSLQIIRYGLTAIAILPIITIFLIAWNDYNYGGDAFMYHVPFAARLWGIVTPEQYTFEYFTENRLLGFPLLANWLMGLFWKITGRIEATNLVAYFSLIALIIYLVKVPKIPFYLAVLSMLAIPMVHMHAARSYIDLPGNVAISAVIITLYLLYLKKIEFNWKSILILFVGAFTAANIKLQLVPIVFLLVLTSLPLFVRHYWQREKPRSENFIQLGKVFGLGFLASLLIFYTPIKNIALYQNPVYPVKITIAGQALNHTESSPEFMHPNIRKLPPPLRWGRSVLEINAFDERRPWPWTLAMDFISWNEERFGMGGYFGAYVIFNVVLLGVLSWKFWGQETKLALIFLAAMTGVTVWMPQSYELRYYMYWMIVFVSLNTYLVCQYAREHKSIRNPLKPEYFGLVALIFTLIFVDKTGKFFTWPSFQDLNQQLATTDFMVKEDLFKQIKDGDKVCIVEKAPFSFFYSSYFHPGRNYHVRAEFNLEDERMKDKCEGYKILR